MGSTPATIRTIAAAANVCSATVSLALRNHPSISSATKQRILSIAKKQNYRPDPVAKRLMAHIRSRPSTRPRALICALSSHPPKASSLYGERIDHAARAKAETMGYLYTRYNLSEFEGNTKRLRRMLSAQRVDGILLLPMTAPKPLNTLLEWDNFSVLSTTYAVLSPVVHKVVPNQFSNTLLVCQALVERGYRRIGLITSRVNDIRVRHHFTAALMWHSTYAGVEAIEPLVH